MEIDLIRPRQVTSTKPSGGGGWLISLACGHVVWSAKALMTSLVCGLCAQRLVRQVQKLCASQAPPAAYIRNDHADSH